MGRHLFFIATLTYFCFINPITALSQGFVPGEIIHNDGTVEEGLIKHKRAWISYLTSRPSSIVFKVNKKKKSYRPGEIKSFKVEEKQFVTVKTFKINTVNGKFSEDFAEQLLVGRLNLYMHYSAVHLGEITYLSDRFIICDTLSDECLGVYGIGRQREEVSEMFSENSEIQDTILHAKVNEINIFELVKFYNGQF